MDLELHEVMLRMALGLALGAMIGLERQWRQRMAGLRTNALVALGAASFVALSFLDGSDVSPTRIAAQVVSGIGFLGAGVILREGVNVRGLNTAATLWCSAAAGALAGAGFAAAATISALLVVLGNLLLRPLAQVIGRGGSSTGDGSENELRYHAELECTPEAEMHLRALMLQAVAGSPLRLRALRSRDIDEDGRWVRLVAELASNDPAEPALETAMRRFGLEPGVRALSWEQRAGEGS